MFQLRWSDYFIARDNVCPHFWTHYLHERTHKILFMMGVGVDPQGTIGLNTIVSAGAEDITCLCIEIEDISQLINPGSARYNPNMTDDEKSTYHNLILVCPTCHGIIDNNCQEYTVEKLEQIKNNHEKWVFESLRIHMPEVDFAELKVNINHLSHVPIQEDVYCIPIPTKDKIEKSKLSPQVENLIKHGMVQLKQVKNYLDKNADRQFVQRLLDFASNNSSDIVAKAATYLHLFISSNHT